MFGVRVPEVFFTSVFFSSTFFSVLVVTTWLPQFPSYRFPELSPFGQLSWLIVVDEPPLLPPPPPPDDTGADLVVMEYVHVVPPMVSVALTVMK